MSAVVRKGDPFRSVDGGRKESDRFAALAENRRKNEAGEMAGARGIEPLTPAMSRQERGKLSVAPVVDSLQNPGLLDIIPLQLA